MREENLVKAAMIKKAYNDLQQLSENNLLKVSSYIDEIKYKQDQMVKMIKTGLELGE
ncbi:hypothetical protein D3C84_1183320 [compost metagenome]